MLDPQQPGPWKDYEASLTVNDSTRAKILVDETLPAVLPAISGETALPGEVAVRQRVLTGGQRIIDGNFASTDAADKSVVIWKGTVLTRQADMGVASITGQN